MPSAYYVAPYVPLVALAAGGTFAPPPATGRPTNGPRLLIYGVWDWARGTGLHVQRAAGAAGAAKDWCLCRVEQTSAVLTQIDGDNQIIRLPFGPGNLSAPWSSLALSVRNVAYTALESRGIDMDWVVPSTTIREVVNYVVRILRACQQLGTDYPELTLTDTYAAVSPGQRQRIEAWLRAKGSTSAGLGDSTSIRTLVRRLAGVDWLDVRFGLEAL